MFFETLGISMTTEITAAVMLSLNPIFCCICESAILQEKTSFSQKLFLGIGILGVIYIAIHTGTKDGKDTVGGILLILLAVVSGALFMTFSRKSSCYFRPMEITYFSSLLGMPVFNAFNVVRHIAGGSLGGERLYGFHLIGLTLILIRMIGVTAISVKKAKKETIKRYAAYGFSLYRQ